MDYLGHIGDLPVYARTLTGMTLAVISCFDACAAAGTAVSEEELHELSIAVTEARDFLFEWGFRHIERSG